MSTSVSKCGAPTAAEASDVALRGAEKRREPRFPCRRVVPILPLRGLSDAGFRNVMLSDCSRSGLRFISAEPLERGEQFLAKLSLNGAETTLIYTVRHCARFADDAYTVGAEFTGFFAAPFAADAQVILDALLSS